MKQKHAEKIERVFLDCDLVQKAFFKSWTTGSAAFEYRRSSSCTEIGGKRRKRHAHNKEHVNIANKKKQHCSSVHKNQRGAFRDTDSVPVP